MVKLSVVLATFNEGKNLNNCLASIQSIADEIVIVDGGSKDKTVEIAKGFKAKVIQTDNPPIFHINKQKALDKASGKWILQLDADEIVSKKLAEEIIKVIRMDIKGLEKYQSSLGNKELFLKHQKIIEERDGKVGSNYGEFAAFFVPRLNYFLGKYLRYGGVYPDGVIRLVKKGKAWFPCKSVHEQIQVKGRVGWLENDLLHFANPTFARYMQKNSLYIDLIASDLSKNNVPKNFLQFINYCFIKFFVWFFSTQIRHKGILDGFQGIIFSFFSALRFPRAYIRYLIKW